MPRASEAIVQALKEAGISTIFGIPSIHNIGLYDAIRRDGSFRHIVCRHEAAATHMADGYARASGGTSVIISSTGPGAGFTLSALQEAWGSCSPVLMMTSNIDAAKIGQGLGVLHELEEQTSLFRTVTKATYSLRAGDDPYTTMKQALALTRSNRPGPVYMEVPHDLWGSEVTIPASSPRNEQAAPLPSRLDEAVALLRRA
ncbi:MAG: thiamine pyrophosphate-binding protein, partial [Deltaproteobacteria bacterium]|nr:thiamine pyrophosphate-binding protein [Deltaproteobacteria bacterium]